MAEANGAEANGAEVNGGVEADALEGGSGNDLIYGRGGNATGATRSRAATTACTAGQTPRGGSDRVGEHPFGDIRHGSGDPSFSHGGTAAAAVFAAGSGT